VHAVCALQASLASLRAEWSAELAALKADVEHKRRLAAATLKARQEEEDIKVRHTGQSALRHLLWCAGQPTAPIPSWAKPAHP
jgi:hypothetical protein